ncbi:serine/threonine-protein kinase [Microcoleus sp. FACHB-672]|uniref:serine/threonine-protein kinase n=1 Tax=Microcoleus sp. FACHB-672 TaxID=2692825 RepID=UPI001686898E|nr:serine/threonine-protein kinase [Microcoleus sp. FACHB-672]MBD2043713.1 GUN4 domain-containing protein [Microcoleus sp. FACHB-672]
MTYCVIPGCQQPQNPDTAKICQSCGSKLWLKERYRPIQQIGQGGFGRTFLAVDEDIPSQPRCVVKQLYFQQGSNSNFQKATQLFHQEAVRLEHLGTHPQIPSLLAHFEQNKWLYLAQELIEGETLSQQLKQQGVFNEKVIFQLLQDLLPVLQYIHEQQVIHRDIKPANIMRRRSDGKFMVIDFGIAKLFAGTNLSQTGTIIGSLEYMAPEQTRGKTLPASDLYSLGATCIHLLTGIAPSNLYDMTRDRWAWRDYLPTGTDFGGMTSPASRIRLGKVLDKLLQNALNQRYLSADEVLQALNEPVKPPAPERVNLCSVKRASASIKSPQPAAVQPLLPQPNNSFLNKLFRRVSHRSQGNDLLTSAMGVDYRKLRDLLAAHKWQEADQETKTVLFQAAGKRGGYIDTRHIEQLPCQDLQTIDRLWVKYSAGRFGFSVQKKIYDSVAGDYAIFCERIGWPAHNPAIPNNSLKFKSSAPAGHLPSRTWVGGISWWQHAGAMSEKLSKCNPI